MVRIAVVQSGSILHDTTSTIQKLREFSEKAAKENVELVLFPEAYIGGYPKGIDFGVKLGIRSDEGRAEFQRYFEGSITFDGKESNEIAEIAKEYSLYLIVGVVEREGHTLYCSVFFYGPNGEKIGKHRKLVPTALERSIWGQGDVSTLEVFQTKIGKIGAAICWENYMPLLRTHYYQQGIEIYLAPTVDDRDGWLSSMRMIAMEGRCYVVSACQFLTTNNFAKDHSANDGSGKVLIRGGSCVISPLGKILVEPVFDKEAFHVVDLDISEIIRGKFDLDTVGHYSRKDIFQLHVNKNL